VREFHYRGTGRFPKQKLCVAWPAGLIFFKPAASLPNHALSPPTVNFVFALLKATRVP
jgi:hypothetical protein